MCLYTYVALQDEVAQLDNKCKLVSEYINVYTHKRHLLHAFNEVLQLLTHQTQKVTHNAALQLSTILIYKAGAEDLCYILLLVMCFV
jgi:hypothetical protein